MKWPTMILLQSEALSLSLLMRKLLRKNMAWSQLGLRPSPRQLIVQVEGRVARRRVTDASVQLGQRRRSRWRTITLEIIHINKSAFNLTNYFKPK